MALNYPGPYEVRLYYTTAVSGISIQHSARYNCFVDPEPDPGDPFSSINVLRRDGTPFALDSEVDDWVAMAQPLYSSTAGAASFDFAELWKYEPASFDASFISTYAIGLAGTTAGTLTPYGQVIVTFRTTLGGIMKINWMESLIGIGNIDTLPFANAALDTMADAIVAGTVPWTGRDNGYPFACIAEYPGQSEALFKRRAR